MKRDWRRWNAEPWVGTFFKRPSVASAPGGFWRPEFWSSWKCNGLQTRQGIHVGKVCNALQKPLEAHVILVNISWIYLEYISKKTIVLEVIYSQQFRGTVLLKVFDLQGFRGIMSKFDSCFHLQQAEVVSPWNVGMLSETRGLWFHASFLWAMQAAGRKRNKSLEPTWQMSERSIASIADARRAVSCWFEALRKRKRRLKGNW